MWRWVRPSWGRPPLVAVSVVVWWFMGRPWVWLAGHGGEGGGDFLEAGFDVGGGCWSGVVGVSGVGAGDPVAEVAFYPGEGGVAEPVGGDALGGDPGESVAEAFPEVVVASAGEWVAVAVPEQRVGGEDRAAGGGVVDQAVGEGWGDGLPADRAALLPELDQATVGVEVLEPDGEGAAAPGKHTGVADPSLGFRR